MSQPALMTLFGIVMLVGSAWNLLSLIPRHSAPLISRVLGIALSTFGIVLGLVLLYRAVTYEAPVAF